MLGGTIIQYQVVDMVHEPFSNTLWLLIIMCCNWQSVVIHVFIKTMYHMTMWKQSENVKGVACSDEFKQNYHLNLQLLSALRSFKVSVHCLTVQPATLLLWFTLTALIVFFSAAAGSCFQWKSCKNSLSTTCSAANSIMEHFETKDISLRSLWRLWT